MKGTQFDRVPSHIDMESINHCTAELSCLKCDKDDASQKQDSKDISMNGFVFNDLWWPTQEGEPDLRGKEVYPPSWTW